MSCRPNSTRPMFTLGAAAALVGAALLTGAGAAPAGAMVQSDTKANQDRSRRVCRTITPTSSRLVQRVCRTQQEWDEQARATQDSVLKHSFDQTRNGNVGGPGFSGDPR